MAYKQSLAALSDQTRRTVFERVIAGPRSVGEIAHGLPISRPAVSQHLKILRDAGLVQEQREGTRRIYSADAKALSNFLGSDTGMKFRHLRWNRVYLAQQRAITDRADPAYSAGIAFGIFGTVAEEDSLLQVSLPEQEFGEGNSGFRSVNR